MNHKTFTKEAVNNSSKNKYIQKVMLNGKPYTKSYITHSDIAKGGKLIFYMGDKPSSFGTKKSDRPVSNKVY
jgi:putative alpha-1,2-mannosidase